MTSFDQLRRNASSRLSNLGNLTRGLVLFVAVVAISLALFWLFNEIFYYFAAKTYADEIAQAYNLNRGFGKALLWASFALIIFFGGCTFSFSKKRRTVGYVGILALLVGHGVLLGLRDANYDTAGNALKCYVLTRDGFKVLNHVGTDPDTGRECKLLTPQMVEKYNAYKNGRRPASITDNDPTFFDPVSGEPVVWFSKTANRVDLFDLMGFDPRTGDELKPIDRTTIEQWRSQSAKTVRRAPNKIVDPDKFGFFDPVSGKPKLWYWTSSTSEYEFYDGPGFHQKFGDELKLITAQAIADWRKALDEKRKADDQKVRAERESQRQQETAKQAAIEAQALAERQASEARRKQEQTGSDCDRLAANPTDTQRKADGVGFNALKFQSQAAFDACDAAVKQNPSELRYQYQLARSAQFVDKKKAFDLLTSLTNAGYAAAFDNLGGLYVEKNDIGSAVKLFQAGVKLGDADSMFTLATLIAKGYYTPPDATSVRLALLKRSGELGNVEAQTAFEAELQQAQSAQQEAIIRQQTQQQMIEIFGSVLQSAIRR